MVFEAIVVDILNRFLGEYVENLDTSQLKIGIWGGDVVLKDLSLKATALSELNLPIKVTWGQLGRLVLKIPWKNIYKEPVIVNIEDLLVLVSPESDIVYIPEREEKWAQDAKQAELTRVEEAKKFAAEKDAAKADDTFVEKLTTQIIKNVQVSVQRIHLRYEDKTTRGGQGAFSVGATMNNLSMHTTDENGKPCLSSTANFIYKSLLLDGLAVYWNSTGDLLSDLPLEKRIHRFKNDIPTANAHCPGYAYMFGPLSSSASLVMNPKPELDGTNFTTPKLQLKINMNEFNVALTRRQFQDMMLLVENMDRLNKGRAFRKYRPAVGTVLGHARTWWRFAYKCVMVDIVRRRNEWTWAYIVAHRQKCKDYLECYTRVLVPKPPPDEVKRARELESQLDVLNLVMLRQRASLEAQRLAVAEEKARATRGWFSGWFSSQPTADQQFSDAIAQKLENAMTPDEKLKLYDAIGYQENVTPTMYPTTFIATQMNFQLSLVRVAVHDDGVTVLNAELRDLGAQFGQRPAANALKLSVSFGRFSVEGMQYHGQRTDLVTSECDGKERLIEALYETAPIDGLCDQRILVRARPLRLIYNHETVNCLKDIFTSADSSGINQVKAKTAASIPTFKQVSAMGLQFAVERRSRLDLRVDVSASTILVPYGGVYIPGCNMLVLKLGQLSVNTDEQKTVSDVSVRKLFLQGSTEEEIFSSILSESYTKFNCRLTGVQMLMCVNKEDWMTALDEVAGTPLHLLQRTDLEVVIKKSLVTEDARIPKMIIEGVLPSISIQISDERVLALAALAFSMQSPEPEIKEAQSRSSSTWSLASISSWNEQRRKDSAVLKSKAVLSDTPIVQGTDLICTFKMNEFAVNIINKTGRFLRFAALHLNVEFVQRTLEMVLDVTLSAVEMFQRYNHADLPVLGSNVGGRDKCLVSLHAIMCDRSSPELFTTKGGVLTSVLLSLSQMNIVLHQAALRSLIDFANNLLAKVDAVKNAEVGREADCGPTPSILKKSRKLSLIPEDDGHRPKSINKSRRKGKAPRVEVIDLKATVVVERVGIDIVSEAPIARLAVEGIRLGVTNCRTSSVYGIVLEGLRVQDLDPKTAYGLVVWSADQETVHVDVTMYNKDQVVDGVNEKLDMRVVAVLGQLRLVYLQRFLTRLLSFVNAFQTAKEAVLEASAAAAERAKQNVIKAYDDATRIALDVNMKAPFIVIPRNSKNTDALVIDLGTVSINNVIKDLNKCAEGIPVLDIMRLELHELKLMRAAVKPDDLTVVVEYPLLDPVTFELVVNRNLSASWYHAVPDLELSSRLGSIRIDLDQMDYAFMMAVLQENIGQGDDNATQVQRASLSTNASEREENIAIPAVHTAIMFTFAMDSFTISLHNGGCAQLSKDVRPVTKRRALALFIIQTLALKGKMFSDGAIYTSIKLLDCVLVDNRQGTHVGVTTMMERKRDEEDLNSMIDITYQQKLSQKFVDMRVSSFVLVLSMEFLLKLASFLTIEEAKGPELPDDVKHVRYGKKVRSASIPAIDPSKPVSVPDPDSAMTIDLKIERPDIILVENMDDIDTDAIVFHTEIALKYRTIGIKQIINGTIGNLQLYSCCFNPSKRKQTMKEVVKPMTVSLTGSTPEGAGLHLDLHCTPIVIAVSPSTIQLLSKCYAAFNNSGSNEGKQEDRDWSNVWTPKKFNDHDYWFLLPDEAREALDALSPELVVAGHLQELCIIEVPVVVITVEAGVGNRTVPMVLLEMGFSGQARNWTDGLQLESSLSFGMQYYNASLSLWEPLVEPVRTKRGRQVEFKPWQLNCSVSMNKIDEDDEGHTDLTPAMSVTLDSRESLEITVTRTCLDVLNQLGEAFANAVADEPATNATASAAPGTCYVFRNDSGMKVLLLLQSSQLKTKTEEMVNCTLKNHEQVEVRIPDEALSASPGRISYSPTSPSHRDPGCFLAVQLEHPNKIVLNVPLDRACKRVYPFKLNDSVVSMVAEITCGQSSTIVTFRSTVQIHNHFSVTLDCFFMTNAGNMVERAGQVEPHGTLNLPFYAVYTKTSELFFSVDGYRVSIVPFKWMDLQRELNKEIVLQCDSKEQEDVDPFFISATGEVEQVYMENSARHTLASMCFNIHLQPTVELFNSLPCTLTLAAQGGVAEKQIPPGTRAQVPHANPGKSTITLRISNYSDKEWSCRVIIPKQPTDFLVWSFESFDSAAPVAINLGAHCSFIRGTLSFSVYCPFWMINKTGLMLSYQLDDSSHIVYHPNNYMDPIMLSPSSKKFVGKKKGQVKIEQGFWSDKFSMDVAGSSGLIECRRNDDRIFKISVNIKLTDSSLTKMIILTPAYVVVNETNLRLDLEEVGSKLWMLVEPKDCAAFWPSKDRNSRLRLRVTGTSEISPPFDFHSTNTCLIQLHNRYGGILADVQSTAGGIYIHLFCYEPGLAPALIINHTDQVLVLKEKDAKHEITLQPQHSVMYSWQNPAGSRCLIWSTGTKDIVFSLNEDVAGAVNKKDIWYTSFLDGLQRVLLVTKDDRVACAVQAAGTLERPLSKINFSLSGMGLSIVNNRPPKSTELLYVGFVSSGVIWETRKLNHKRHKPLPLRESSLIEEAYSKYIDDVAANRQPDHIVVLDNKLQVNLETLQLLAPNKRELRRSFQPAVWVEQTQTEHTTLLHAKLNRMQLDNQTQNAIFPVILAPVPPPKTVAAGNGPKPFFELSILKRITPHSAVQQYKYFKVLVQEFHVKLDVGFVHSLGAFLEADKIPESVARQRFLQDVDLSKKPLLDHIVVVSSQEHKDFFDLLHFSPLKIHLSFSMAGNMESKSLPAAFNLLLQSLGVTLTDIQDAVFKLSCMERNNIFLTKSQLIGEATTHYSGQALRQVYVILLGLDVIGNPYGLVTGIGEGVEALFYEPFQGIIQGPAEFAEGLGLGVKSLFGHTVGGAAGAFGRITGTLGKGLAALSMDKEYQQQRLEQQRRQDNLHTSMAQGGRGLVMGVVHGVTGVVTKPIAGAKEEGVGGFFKGFGKGVVGLVTRPVTGVVDFASTSLNVVKRATEQGSDASRLRPPRLLRGAVVDPYRLDAAEGNVLLAQLDHGKYAATDEYEYHVNLYNGDVLILTDKRFIIATMSDVFATWQVNLTLRWSELYCAPTLNPKGILVTLERKKQSAFSSFSQGRENKLIPVPQSDELQFLLTKMSHLYEQEASSNAR